MDLDLRFQLDDAVGDLDQPQPECLCEKMLNRLSLL